MQIPWHQAEPAFEKVLRSGRVGLRATRLAARLQASAPWLAEPRGTLRCWILPLDGFHPCHTQAGMRLNLGEAVTGFSLLADHPDLRSVEKAAFQVVWDWSWHPSFYAKFFRGPWYPGCFDPTDRAICIASHFHYPALRWLRLAVVWDHPAGRYGLYVNGVCVAAENQFVLDPSRRPSLSHDTPGDQLFAGDPALAYGETLDFTPEALDELALAQDYANEDTDPDPALQRELRHIHLGDGNPRLDFQPDSSWRPALDLPLTRPDDLAAFHLQGNACAATITPEGLRLATPWVNQRIRRPGEEDHDQLYLWTRTEFEGDLLVEFDFMPLRPGGLGVLVLQACGLHREDFLLDHAPRTNGWMRTIYGEDIRNYHWEYWREMNDVRNDRPSSALVKNPWFRPLSLGTHHQRPALHAWHRVQFVQIGGHLRGAVDGELVVEARDDAALGHGPVLRCGHLALRAMVRTDMLVRSLRIRHRPDLERPA